MQKERASKKQQELLSFVDGFIKGNGYGPSYREIMRALGYKSVSTVAIHIDGLIAKGYLARRDKSARSLEVVTTKAPSADAGSSDIEQQLTARLAGLDLTNEEKQVVKQGLVLLGYRQAAEAVRLEDDEEREKDSDT